MDQLTVHIRVGGSCGGPGGKRRLTLRTFKPCGCCAGFMFSSSLFSKLCIIRFFYSQFRLDSKWWYTVQSKIIGLLTNFLILILLQLKIWSVTLIMMITCRFSVSAAANSSSVVLLIGNLVESDPTTSSQSELTHFQSFKKRRIGWTEVMW